MFCNFCHKYFLFSLWFSIFPIIHDFSYVIYIVKIIRSCLKTLQNQTAWLGNQLEGKASGTGFLAWVLRWEAQPLAEIGTREESIISESWWHPWWLEGSPRSAVASFKPLFSPLSSLCLSLWAPETHLSIHIPTCTANPIAAKAIRMPWLQRHLLRLKVLSLLQQTMSACHLFSTKLGISAKLVKRAGSPCLHKTQANVKDG